MKLELVKSFLLVVLISSCFASQDWKQSYISRSVRPRGYKWSQQDYSIFGETAVKPVEVERPQVEKEQPPVKEGITITFDSRTPAKANNAANVLDKLFTTILKPANLINILKVGVVSLSTLVLSTLIIPMAEMSRARVGTRINNRNAINHGYSRNVSPSSSGAGVGGSNIVDLESIVDILVKIRDERVKMQSENNHRDLCREKFLCTIGDMVTYNFPSLGVSTRRVARQYLPQVEKNGNKFTRAFLLGLNQTNCDKTYNSRSHECPSIMDYVRSYLQGAAVRRSRSQYFRFRSDSSW